MKILVKHLAILLIVCACSKKSDEEVLPTAPMYLEYANWTLTKISSQSKPAINRSLDECGTDTCIFKDGNIFIERNGNTCGFTKHFDRELYLMNEYKIKFARSNFDYPDGEATVAYSGNTMTWYFPPGNSNFNLNYDFTLTFTEKK